MKYLWLIRHGAHDFLGKRLVGRLPGVVLNDAGYEQADLLATAFQDIPLTGVFSSPLERTRQTAAPTAQMRALPVQIDEMLQEVDFGAWTGMSFEELSLDGRWSDWNDNREAVPIPFGEDMPSVQRRMLEGMAAIVRPAGGHVALFSHGDSIRSVLAYLQGKPLRALASISFEPADLALIEYAAESVRLCSLIEHARLEKNPALLREAWQQAVSEQALCSAGLES